MKNIAVCIMAAWWFAACGNPVTSPERVDEWPDIYPDYIGVTIPATIAPMNFNCIGGAYERVDVTVTGGKSGEMHVNDKIVSFPQDAWQELLEENKGDSLLFTVCIRKDGEWKQYRSFPMYVSPYPIDYGVVYRKLAPGYEVYSKMGIYERDLASFEERPLLENTMVPGMCLNCHAFNKTNPDHLSLHIRGKNGGTLMQIDGKREMLDTKTDSTLSAGVYPYWHPNGKYIAYSVNNTRQSFHAVKDERVEVLDLESDVLVYHPETHELLLSPLLQKKEVFETFPVFSPDGRKLYFCTAEAKPIPAEYKEIRYSLCSIDFNPEDGNGIFTRYKYPVVTAAHTPVFWRYDLDEKSNPYLMERIGMNATMNSGAIKWNGKYLMVVRVEGADRKSFFAVAESPNGIDNFRFWDYPISMPEDTIPATNVYDMRLTAHEYGWIYGIFCAERHDDNAPAGDLSSATATAAIARTKDLKNWERLPDLKTKSQQRNVVLHPEFVDGKYALYTRPQDGFIDAGSGGGIGWALVDDITHAEVKEEKIIDQRYYHTIKEVKNGEGPHPIKTPKGWLHLAHGVRGCAAGLRYVLYMYMTSLEDPTKLIATPGGAFMVPEGEERIGDVSNVLFTNGWIADEDGTVFIYYASSDTRMHVATSTIDKLVDYCMNTPADGLSSSASVETLKKLIDKNLQIMK